MGLCLIGGPTALLAAGGDDAVSVPEIVRGSACQDGGCFRFADSLAEEPVPHARFNWKGTLLQSGMLLGTQHALRMVQHKTRAELGGPFWRDYRDSLDGLHGWDDGNPLITNYGGHPMMGAVTSYIQIQNDPRGIALKWEPHNAAYWKSRFKAMGWAAAYSTSYELAPWGEAGIGNVGKNRGTMGYVDLVVTPLAGMGLVLLEDYLDLNVVSRIERGRSAGVTRLLRAVLNPDRSVANALRLKRPSHRDTRPPP